VHLTVFVTALVSALVPAIGTYRQYGLPAEATGFKATGYLVQLERLPCIRDGALRVLNISKIGGIITFPSFHAAAAILALWACWSVWWIRPLALITNIGMLMVTPLVGGHYFVDVNRRSCSGCTRNRYGEEAPNAFDNCRGGEAGNLAAAGVKPHP
jgi:PAP2 superfamily